MSARDGKTRPVTEREVLTLISGFLADFHAERNDSLVMDARHYLPDAQRLAASLEGIGR